MTRKAGERAEDVGGAARPARRRHRGRVPGRQGVGPARDARRSAPIWTRASRWSATRSRSCAAEGRRVFFDAEHFFDGYVADAAFAMRVLAAAEEAGAERLVLCDTNGGMLPFDVARIVAAVKERVGHAARHPRAQRRRLRGRELADRGRRRRAPGAGRRSTATASGPGTPTSIPISARPGAEDGGHRRAARTARSGTSPSSRTTSRRSRTSRPTRTSRTRAGAPSRTRPACTRAAWPGCSRAYEHVAPEVGRQPPRRRGLRLRRAAPRSG